MNDDLLVRGGRLIDPPTGTDVIGDLLIRNGQIVAQGEILGQLGEMPTLDARGLVVAPGFIDLHTHLRFPGFPEKETLHSGTLAAAAGGFTTVCAMANTNPIVDTPEVLRYILAEAEYATPVRVRQLASVSYGLAGLQLTDFPTLFRAGAVAFSDDGKPIVNADLMKDALRAAAKLGAVISVHEEDPDIVRGGVANAGAVARAAGLAEWPCTGEASLVARDLALLAETGGRLHIAHVSCRETVALLRGARAAGLRVTAEATPHHLRLTDSLLAGDEPLNLPPAHPHTKVNPPLRSAADVEAIVAALADGTIDAIATDHAPHAAADKTGPYADAAFGFTAIETALPLTLDLVRAGHLSLITLLQRLTSGPAAVFNLPGGALTPGSPGDLCVFDPDEIWTVTADALHSQGKNTPLLGAQLQGRVRATVVGGRVVFRWPCYCPAPPV